MSRPYKPRAGFWIRLCVVLLVPLDSLLFKIDWRHQDRIPEKGGVLLVVNHLSYIDTILMARLVWSSGRIPRFLIKSGVFSKPIVGRVMKGSGQIPVHRGTSDAQKSLRDGAEALQRGECVIIYAEGTITQDPEWWPMQAKTGVARLALMAPDALVIPIGQWGPQFSFNSRARKFRPFPRKPSLASIGEPLDLDRFRGDDSPGQLTLRRMTDAIMEGVRDQVALLRGETAPTTFFRPRPVKKAKPEVAKPEVATPKVAKPEVARPVAAPDAEPAPGESSASTDDGPHNVGPDKLAP
ncbi:MAG: plsC [Pseudonocardiales bacterium]|nr:plsC [Pseudonocardiales bacterium]